MAIIDKIIYLESKKENNPLAKSILLRIPLAGIIFY